MTGARGNPDEPAIPGADDDSDLGWDWREGAGTRDGDPDDDRLTRERPPHW